MSRLAVKNLPSEPLISILERVCGLILNDLKLRFYHVNNHSKVNRDDG